MSQLSQHNLPLNELEKVVKEMPLDHPNRSLEINDFDNDSLIYT